MKLEERVYKKLLEVPSGMVVTYGELARAVGLKNGQRKIGQIMKTNPFPVIIPCHRVVNSDGNIGGYAFGIERKVSMLYKEGIEISNCKIVRFKDRLFYF